MHKTMCFNKMHRMRHFASEITNICHFCRFVLRFCFILRWILRNEDKNPHLRVEMRHKSLIWGWKWGQMKYNCRFWRISSTQLWGHFSPEKSPRSDIFELFPALLKRWTLIYPCWPWPFCPPERTIVKITSRRRGCEILLCSLILVQ